MTFVFDSLLSGSQTMGHWTIADDSVNVDLARNAHALWKALNPQHAPIFGRWVRAHRGNRFNARVDKLAKRGLVFESAPRKVYWKDIRIAVETMGKSNAAIRPHLLDHPVEDLYITVTGAHTAAVDAILPQLS